MDVESCPWEVSADGVTCVGKEGPFSAPGPPEKRSSGRRSVGSISAPETLDMQQDPWSDCEDIIEDEMNEWLQEASKACHDPSGEDGFLIKQVAREDDPGCVEVDLDEDQSWLPWEQIAGLCDNFQDACSTLLDSTASIPRPTFRAVRD
uniref:Uncharacterized protein n=1 Tax=Noctiluca scintillans TaxID=2966 RepID=A0A7S0ZPH9_NOCSC